jgi:hypothetical protein
MTSLGVILITLAVSGLVFLLWLVLEGEQEPNPTVTYGDYPAILEDLVGVQHDPTEGIQPPDVYPDDLRGSH